MEGKGKGDGHQHRQKPRIPEPVLIVSPSEEVRGTLDTYWALSPWINGWMEYCITFSNTVLLAENSCHRREMSSES